jgi:hypothetical protein
LQKGVEKPTLFSLRRIERRKSPQRKTAMNTPHVEATYLFPGVAAALLALSRARMSAIRYRRWSAADGFFGRNAPASAAACAVFAANYGAIAERIERDLLSGVYERGVK